MNDRIRAWLRLGPRVETTPATLTRGRVDHVIILDGTMSSLAPGRETNAGLLYKLLCEVAVRQRLSLRYEAGVQWDSWTNTRDVIEGRGINRQIRRVYGFLASRYRPGDRIYLFGYSRGAYAARSLAGFIGAVGLLRAEKATVRNIRLLYRGYQTGRVRPVLATFSERHCHPGAEIEMVGVWDTVKALGLRAPVIWRWADAAHEFHDHHLNRHVKRGYHALALDETREAFAPVLWSTDPDWPGEMEQVWFRGAHGDIGGQLGGFDAARPLANIPLVWMLERAAACGLPLPSGWAARFPLDAGAPSVGTWRGWGKFFVARRRRVPLRDPSEALHSSVTDGQVGVAV
ncbi:MAG: DUF2235 domain-containing protein [Paracoccaceae bacterium]